MLTTIFLYSAVVGTVIMVCQFAMTLLGVGDDGADMDADFDGDVSVDADHGSSWLFGVLSFRTLVAAVAFFGLGGYAALSSGQSEVVALLIAFGCGVAAMYGVYALLRGIYRLQADGTRRIDNAIGSRGSVLVPVPPGGSGVGKIQLKLQGRLVDVAAVSAGTEKLSTGTRVEVIEVLGPNTVRVERTVEVVPESEHASIDNVASGGAVT